MDELDQRRVGLRSEIAAAEAGPELPRLHGNLAEVYRAKVPRLREALLADGGTTALLRGGGVESLPVIGHTKSPLADA